MELGLGGLQNRVVQQLQPGPHPALRQSGIAHPEAVRVKKPLNGVLKHPGGFAGETLELTGIQNAHELRFPVRPSVRARARYRRTDISVTGVSMTKIFITWPPFPRFWNLRFCGFRSAVFAVLGTLILRFLGGRGKIRTVKNLGIGVSGGTVIRVYKGGAGVVRVVLGHHGSQVNLVGVAPAAPLLPDQVQLLQCAESRRHPLLADPQLPCQLFPGEDDEYLPEVVHPAVPAGELKAVEQKGIGHLGVQAHTGVPGIRKQPAGHLHMVNTLHVRLPHERKGRALFHGRGPHWGTSSLVSCLKSAALTL